MTNTMEIEEPCQTDQTYVGEGITCRRGSVFEKRLEGDEGISQEALWDRGILEMGCKGPKFGDMLGDFQDNLELM